MDTPTPKIKKPYIFRHRTKCGCNLRATLSTNSVGKTEFEVKIDTCTDLPFAIDVFEHQVLSVLSLLIMRARPELDPTLTGDERLEHIAKFSALRPGEIVDSSEDIVKSFLQSFPEDLDTRGGA